MKISTAQIFDLFELTNKNKNLLQKIIRKFGYKRNIDILQHDIDEIKQEIITETGVSQ